ncbi:fimbrillin family protein [Bacteroides sp.]
MKLIVKLSLALALFASCAQNEIRMTDEIRLGVKSDAYTRAAVNDIDGLVKVGDQIGVYGVNIGSSSKAVPAKTKWGSYTIKNICTTEITKKGVVNFGTGYNYPEGEHVRFFAYHPYAEIGTQGTDYLEESTETRAPLLHFTTDGTIDVMYADPVVGSQVDSGSKLLLFNHALTQMHFKLVDTNGILAGAKVKSIIFSAVNTASTLNIETGELGTWNTPANITLDLAKPLEVTAAGVAVEGNIMLQPGLSGFTLNVVTDNSTYSDVKIKPDKTATFEAGTSYEITLRFTDKKEIKSLVTIQPWIMAGYADNIIQ